MLYITTEYRTRVHCIHT